MDWNIASGLIAAQMLWVTGLCICLRAGVFALGNLAFGMFGAYFGAIAMTRWELSWAPATILAGLAGAALALVSGYFFRGLSDHFFAISTIVLLMVMGSLVTGLKDLTGGAIGLAGIPIVTETVIPTVMIVVLLAGLIVFERSRLAHVIDIVGREPFAAEALGIRPVVVRVATFTVAGGLTAAGGSWFAAWYGFIDPSVIGLHNQLDVVAAAVVGGFGNPFGPLVGVSALYVLGELTREVSAYRDIVTGIVVIAFALLAPRGLTALLGDLWRRVVGRGRRARNAAQPDVPVEDAAPIPEGLSSAAHR